MFYTKIKYIFYRLKYTFYTLLLLVANLTNAQNLVPNPGFETYFDCPSTSDLAFSPDYTAFPVVAGWVNPMKLTTSDYFNTCATLFSGIPDNLFGSQPSHAGNGYIGMFTYEGNVSMTEDNYREYAECKLISPMLAGHQYYISFYVSTSEDYLDYYYDRIAIDKMGAYLSNEEVTDSTDEFLSLTPQIVNTLGYLTDTLNWVKISGVYTAVGGEQWLTLGHFYNPSLPLSYTLIGSGAPIDFISGYIYVDDVCAIDMATASITTRDTAICLTSFPATLPDLSVGNTRQWSTGDTGTNATINTTGTYWVRTWADCAYFVDTIRVLPIGDTTITHVDTVICAYAFPATLHSDIVSTHTLWSTGDTTANTIISSPGNYWVRNIIGCNVYIDTVKVMSSILDSFSSVRDTIICSAPFAVVLNHIHNGIHYHWNTGDTTKQIIATHYGVYSVVTIDSSCNYYNDTIKIDSLPVPGVSVLSGCKHIPNSAAWVTFPPSDTLTYTYTWKDSLGNVLQVDTNSMVSDTLQHVWPGNYSVYITNPLGCDISLNVTIPYPAYSYGFIGDTLTCIGDTITFANTSIGTFTDYLWLFGDGMSSTEISPQHAYTNDGHFTIEMISYPCADTATAVIMVDNIDSGLSFTMKYDTLCQGMYQQLYTSSAPGLAYFTWSFGDGSWENAYTDTEWHSYDICGLEVVTLTGQYRVCPSRAFNKAFYVAPYPIVNLGPDTSLCPASNPLFLQNQVTNPTSERWKWNTGEATKSIFADDTGIYWLTITNAYGCSTTDSVEIMNACYMDIPNAFSPNNDGINDYFFPRQLLSSRLSKFHMQIFNRWGEMIFETDKLDGRGWDGKFNNVMQPEGVYIYRIEATIYGGAAEVYKGNVTLIK